MAFALSPERDKKLAEIVTRYPQTRAALLPALWLCQEQNGWISPEVIDFVAERLALPAAAVKGVVTFYTMFFDEPVGENVIWVCRTISCDLRGGKAIQEHLEKRLGCHAGETTKDGKFTLLKAECLAACGQAPMVQINDNYFENLDTSAVDRIIDEHLAGKYPKTRPARPAASIPAPRASIPPRASTPSTPSVPARPSAPPKHEAPKGDGPKGAKGEGEG